VAVAAVELGQLAVLGAVGAVLGWRPDLTGLPWALLLLVSGTAAFGALGLLLAGTLRAEAVLATANLLWVLLLVGGAVLVPAELTPGPLGALAPLLPSGALGEGLRSALTGGGAPLGEVATLTVWAGALSWATARTFRWS
jgi:ABC-2 type transport system permease protein